MGEPGDKYEQEADAVAAQVVEKINSPPPQESVQRQSESGVTSVPNITVMRHGEGGVGEGASVTQDVEEGIQRARGGIFNLHIGIYQDPATSRWCVIASDPQECVADLCDPQGCFPTIKDAIQAFFGCVQSALGVLGNFLSVVIGIISFLLKPLLPQSVGQTQEGNNGTITEV
ncbi:hypothetical protein [Limnofasciculus baicalensis]|uniref:Uncharacterized protein n=1 Tax=Limnofasciculus baicalensis BBK-W-15 TaxID=2699891 RepID=A0AAE3GSI5_9CYAN|nr:hypothetical protein [Limnofasciculus baicalensis]MCP2729053.1 hypothetical protein [Limnofasciculus baicalensis BBK-W-15]